MIFSRAHLIDFQAQSQKEAEAHINFHASHCVWYIHSDNHSEHRLNVLVLRVQSFCTISSQVYSHLWIKDVWQLETHVEKILMHFCSVSVT